MNINERVEELREEIVNSTRELVRFRSTEGKAEPGKPFGKDVAECLDKTLDICQELGFRTKNLDGYVGYAEYGQGEDYAAVLGHLDIVPEGDGWTYPPYAAEIHDGKIYARGTLDDKGPVVAALYGLKAIKDLNLPLSKRVRIIFGTNEESGCKEMEHYLEREKPPVSGFTPDGEYPIIYAEKGLTIFNVVKDLNVKSCSSMSIKYIKGGQRANMVPDYCEAGIAAQDAEAVMNKIVEIVKKTGFDAKAEYNDDMIIVKSIGVSAHGAMPYLGKNAIMQMFAILEEIDFGKCDIADFIKFFNKYAGFETDGKSFGVALEDQQSGKLSFNIGVIDMNENKIIMSLNLRYPVTYKLEDMLEPFSRRLEGTGIRIEITLAKPPLYFPEDHYLIKTLQKVYTEQTGLEATLLAIGGGTYAKEMPNIVAFGPIFPGKPDLDHQANEYIEIEDLLANAKIYGNAIYELAK